MRATKQQRNLDCAPKGELASRTLAMSQRRPPTRWATIFGPCWIMSHMDAAGKNNGDRVWRTAAGRHGGRLPIVLPGAPSRSVDTVICYTDVATVGRTSITLDVEVWVLRQGQGDRVKVTEPNSTFVFAVDEQRQSKAALTVREGRRRSGVRAR